MLAAERAFDVQVRVRGTVQGVGFRPFVHRVAKRLGLRGWVRNDAQGVLIRAMGSEDEIATLARELREQAPPAARVESVTTETPALDAPSVGNDFAILPSDGDGAHVAAALPPDLALCAACRAELANPADRRHGYPFINCTQCGPRYSIVERLPYDRARTTMRVFRMCPDCQREYDDPVDRRFHAEPNACAHCGPRVQLVDGAGVAPLDGPPAIAAAAAAIRAGRIVAVKGVGGYHLMVDATNSAAVAELRRRKHRDEKPFAVMFRDLAAVSAFAQVSITAAAHLESPAAPIVLVPRHGDAPLASEVAPGNPWLGALLAYSPLHVLLLAELDAPVVATSANISEEPLCTDSAEAHARLAAIADAFLDHDRPIAHPVDDSVVRLSAVGPVLLRRARGHAPAPLNLPAALDGHFLCVGAQMKSVVGAASGGRLVLSPHIGDLAGAATLNVFRRTIATLAEVHGSEFTHVVCDKHPDYASTRYAQQSRLPCVAVQHHLAHVLACLLEHGRAADGVLGVSFDGTGYGEDHTVWGGELILLERKVAQRFARLRPFRLPGGEAAVRDARRVALALLHECAAESFPDEARTLGAAPEELHNWHRLLLRGVNCPATSSVGRLFDGVGALLGVGQRNRFEGQMGLALEIAAGSAAGEPLPLPVRRVPRGQGAVWELDWEPLLARLRERRADTAPARLAAGFHAALARGIVEVAHHARVPTVALSGGCFQNALLLVQTVTALRAAGFEVLTHRALPPNDGNIAAGQALGALWDLTSVTLP